MLVIEQVQPQSIAEQAGLKAGDRVVSYDSQPLPSPAALQALEENTFGKESLLLSLEREGQPLERSVPPGSLGIQTRPELPDDLLKEYEAGRELFVKGEFAEAGRRWQQAAQQADHTSFKVWLLSKAGEAWEKVSDWQQALQLHLAAWEEVEVSEDGDTASQSETASAIGRCYQNTSEWAEAVAWYTRAERADQDAGREPWRARRINSLGLVTWERGDLQAAQDYHACALQIREHLVPGSIQVAYSLNNLGLVARERGDLQAAQEYYTHALQIFERLAPDSPDMARSLGNLGTVAADRGDLQAAQDYFAHALKIFESLTPNSIYVAIGLMNLGNVMADSSDLQAAQEYYTHALQIFERLAPDSPDMARSLGNLGTVAADRGDLQAAQDYFAHALKIFESLAPNSLDYAEVLTSLGRVLLCQYSHSNALPLLRQAVEILEQQRATIVSPEARALLIAQHTTMYATLIKCHLALDDQAAAFSTLERGRARSLLELLTERRLDFAADAPPQLLQKQQELDRMRARTYDQLARFSITAKDHDRLEALHQQIRDLERQQQELTALIRQASPHYADMQYPQPLCCEQAQALLEPGTLLLSYLIDTEQTFLFALTHKQVRVFTLPVGREDLQEQVRAFRASLDLTALENRSADAFERALQHGELLYQRLLGPAHEQIRKAKRLLLCADGPLHLLPWPALVVQAGKSPSYLGQIKPISTTLSMTLLAQTRQEAREKEEEGRAALPDRPHGAGRPCGVIASVRRLLALGDPLYAPGGSRLAPAFARSADTDDTAGQGSTKSEPVEMGPPLRTQASAAAGTQLDLTAASATGELAMLQTRGLTLSPLPHSRQEVERIGQLFPERAAVKIGAEATKTAVLAEGTEAQVLHFACHGWLDARQPLSSALVFSQPEALGEEVADGDNGLLQAWEIISKLKLDAELVVLSACQSGLGEEVRGEGLVGLTRAFQYAGARSVLVSLWKVHDASTSELMQGFYSGLKEGKSKAEALQAAMAALRRSKRYQHPFFWSAFLLQGE